ncbi:NAD(P)/FAD-dependent oxidoreductase [Frankia sp. Cr1]|uniref:NAD(P)/FAD-dependent oxidoreductase n=1 Tax=Frankia sp. Cr1 TaxID=3073931 RepID=UPI002AD4BE7F|nr:FAD-dependent oxidoreductase [Frankia sp. Cr1]
MTGHAVPGHAPGTRRGVLIVGTGQAGTQTAISLRQRGFDGPITMVGEEHGLPYQRPPLSKAFLTGEHDRALPLRSERFFSDHQIELVHDTKVTSLDCALRRVRLASGAWLHFDHLVLAVGARNRPLPGLGTDLDGVLSLRTVADAEQLRDRMAAGPRVLVIGAGFIGLEFAAVAVRRGLEVTIVEAAGRPMARAVSPVVSAHFAREHRRRGVRLLARRTVTRLIGDRGRVVGAQTDDGERHPVDLVLVGIGVLPNVELAAGAGIAVGAGSAAGPGTARQGIGDGIIVDRYLRTSATAVSAVGDCARFPFARDGGAIRLESVQNAVDQARCVAGRLTGQPEPFHAVPWFWSDQGGTKLQIAGLITGHDETVVRGDPDSGSFSVFCFRPGRLLGVESVNRPADHLASRRLLAGNITISQEQAADPDVNLKALV